MANLSKSESGRAGARYDASHNTFRAGSGLAGWLAQLSWVVQSLRRALSSGGPFGPSRHERGWQSEESSKSKFLLQVNMSEPATSSCCFLFHAFPRKHLSA